MALKVLYSLADHEGGSLEAVLTDFWQNFQFRNDVLGEVVEDASALQRPEVRHFAEMLVCGVAENLEKIDQELSSYSTNWALDRMARVDLAILRLATCIQYARCSHPVIRLLTMRSISLTTPDAARLKSRK